MPRPLSIFPRIFLVNATLFGLVAALLLFSPIRIDDPIRRNQALIVVGALGLTLLVNAPLLRMALAPLGQLAREMEEVDLLRPTQRLPVVRDDEIGRVVATFNRMLGRLEGERREGARRILAAQEAERIGIAHNLHDEVGQVLTAVLLHLDSIGEQAPAHRAEIDEASRAVRGAIDEVRRISSSLRPELLEQLGLVSALTELTREFSRASGIRVTRRFERSLPNLDPDAELAIYRIVQESLTNVARHARAARVTATLEQSRDHVVVRVVDDGQGFGAGPEEHGGVRSIRERALLIGGALAIEPASRGGVEVRLEVPLRQVVQPVGAPS